MKHSRNYRATLRRPGHTLKLVIALLAMFATVSLLLHFSPNSVQAVAHAVGSKFTTVVSGVAERTGLLDYEQSQIHKNITTTIFWVGESANSNNGYIANSASAWDANWQQHYGGIDYPVKRSGYGPSGFIPKEN